MWSRPGLRRFRRLPRSEQRLLLSAFLLVFGARLALWLLPHRLYARLPEWAAPAPGMSRAPGRWGLDQLVWAIRTASRYVPNATCLTQAIAGSLLMSRHGYAPRLRLGVARPDGQALQAHAWIEYQGLVVLGGTADPFTPFPFLR